MSKNLLFWANFLGMWDSKGRGKLTAGVVLRGLQTATAKAEQSGRA